MNKINISDVKRFRKIYRLKSIYRISSVDSRKESSAEHSWSCLLLADFFLERLDIDIDKLRVYELLMYHDLVEIYAGDTPLHPDNPDDNGKSERELNSANRLKDELPEGMSSKYWRCFNEFEKQETIEAKFAKAVDVLDGEIHELDYKDDWKKWDEKFLRDKKEHYFDEFSDLKILFEELIVFLKYDGYI